MRILFWHGYLLSGTGSNVYTQAVAREWSRAGHEVVVVCQEPHPERFDLAGAQDVLAGADAVFVGSSHIRTVLEEIVGHVERVHEVPPGVDVDEFRPRARADALRDLLVEARRDPTNPRNVHERLPDEGNAAR